MKEQVYLLEQFDDIKILRYDVPAFEDCPCGKSYLFIT